MAISFIAGKCPSCGGDIPVDSNRAFVFCGYCGTKIIMNNENEHIYRNIDAAKVTEAETDRIIRLKQLEIMEKDKVKRRKSTFLAYGIALVIAAIGGVICLAGIEYGAFAIIAAMYIAIMAYVKSDGKEKSEPSRSTGGPSDAIITDSMCSYQRKNYQSMMLLYKGGGFTNVTAIPLHDLSLLNQMLNGQVESVTINGTDGFEEGDIFPKDSNVIITYHCK